jgi:hypothetical protein
MPCDRCDDKQNSCAPKWAPPAVTPPPPCDSAKMVRQKTLHFLVHQGLLS